MWTANGSGNSVTKISPTGTTTTYSIGSGTVPDAIAFDGINMWTANVGNYSVTVISPSGTVIGTYSGTGSNSRGIAFDGTSMWTANYASSSVTKIIRPLTANSSNYSVNTNSVISTPQYSSSGGTVSVEALVKLLAPGATTTAYINSLRQTAVLASSSVVSTFTRDLQVGSYGLDVESLQVYLNTHGYKTTSTGPGSPNNETQKFGSLTKQALQKFQKKQGLPATGYFGPLTRALLNTIRMK